MKIAWEVTLRKWDGRSFVEIFEEKEMATRYGVYKSSFKMNYKSYSIKEIVVS